jgi:hypothetical protein
MRIKALLLKQWRSSAKSPPNPNLVKAPLSTDILKLYEELMNAESLLAL